MHHVHSPTNAVRPVMHHASPYDVLTTPEASAVTGLPPLEIITAHFAGVLPAVHTPEGLRIRRGDLLSLTAPTARTACLSQRAGPRGDQCRGNPAATPGQAQRRRGRTDAGVRTANAAGLASVTAGRDQQNSRRIDE